MMCGGFGFQPARFEAGLLWFTHWTHRRRKISKQPRFRLLQECPPPASSFAPLVVRVEAALLRGLAQGRVQELNALMRRGKGFELR